MKRAMSYGVNALCALSILFSVLVGWTAISTPKGQAPSIFGFTMMTVLTGSMEPTLPIGSFLLVRESDPGEIQVGDVITYYTDMGTHRDVINTHRVIALEQADGQVSFRTQGDANLIADPDLVSGGQLIGRAIFHSLILGNIVSFLRTPLVFGLVILIPLLIIIITSIRRMIALAKEEIAQAKQELNEEVERDE